MDNFSAYKPIRNKLRRFKPRSVVDSALNILWRQHESEFRMLQQAPWQTLLLVKWALIDLQGSDRTGKNITEKEFDLIRQDLWRLPDMARRAEGQPIELYLRQLTYQQIEFQRHQAPIFARQPALLGALDQSHPLRQMFFDATGLDVLDFLDLSFATYTAILGGKRYFTISWFDSLRKHYGVAVDAFIHAVSRNYSELVEFFRADPNANKRWAAEFFEFTPLKRYPLFRQGDTFQAWHPLVFSRGIESFMHDVLCDFNAQGYMDQYSKVFEGHVMDLIEKTGRPYLDEDKIRSIIGRRERVTEAILPMTGGNLLVEAKTGVFGEPVMTVGDPKYIASRVKPLVSAVDQARSVASKIYGSDKCPEVMRSNTRNFLIVVTNRLLNISRGSRLRAICGPDLFGQSDADAERYLPLENVYFVSIDEFEHFTVACSDPNFDPIRFLEESVARDEDPVTAKFSFDNHLALVKGVDIKGRFSMDAIKAAEMRLTSALEDESKSS